MRSGCGDPLTAVPGDVLRRTRGRRSRNANMRWAIISDNMNSGYLHYSDSMNGTDRQTDSGHGRA